MSSNKSLTVKRIIIYCVISSLPVIFMAIALYARYREPVFATKDMGFFSYIGYISAFVMLAPAVANILTRIITKEGMKSSYLEVNFGKSPLSYVFSVICKPLEALAVAFIVGMLLLPEIPLSEKFTVGESGITIAVVLFNFAYSVAMFFPAFGEEFGWRAYLMPKLCELMSKPKAIIVGGVIWGVWHAPMTVLGHNFGVGYRGYPFTGIAAMCLYCTLMNIPLTLITEKTGSVYPASFFHSLNNNLSAGMMINMMSSETFLETLKTPAVNDSLNGLMWKAAIPFEIIIGVICFVKLMKNKDGKTA